MPRYAPLDQLSPPASLRVAPDNPDVTCQRAAGPELVPQKRSLFYIPIVIYLNVIVTASLDTTRPFSLPLTFAQCLLLPCNTPTMSQAWNSAFFYLSSSSLSLNQLTKRLSLERSLICISVSFTPHSFLEVLQKLIAMLWRTGKAVSLAVLATLPSCIRCYATTDSIQDTVQNLQYQEEMGFQEVLTTPRTPLNRGTYLIIIWIRLWLGALSQLPGSKHSTSMRLCTRSHSSTRPMVLRTNT